MSGSRLGAKIIVPLVLVAMLGGILAASAVAAVGSWGWRLAELDVLLDRVEASETSMRQSTTAMQALLDSYDQEADPDAEQIDAEISRIAGQARNDVEARGRDVADVSLPEWAHALRDARDAYVQHSLAWREHWDTVYRDPTSVETPSPAIETTWHAAQAAFRRALPRPRVQEQRDRVDAVFAE